MFFSGGCSHPPLFEKNTTICNALWSKYEIISFDVNIEDTTAKYNFFINVRNKTDYDYANLYLFMNTKYPSGDIARDTIECLLADNNGKWFGKGWGKYRFLSLPLGNHIKFPQKGLYSFSFEQAMRTDTLQNISDIGIRIEKSL
ncbi:MAG: Gliding motility lipoprotein GldH precursor [Bacteroidetes bacterium ADurb.Bin408]|nr:MAG: Gliding motility lipoprotein GldH precursor [Bacteroidetes bacterium ADurb.Bin408]